MTIDTFNHDTLKVVREQLNLVLEVLSEGDLAGVTFEVGNMSFSNNSVKIGLVGRTEGAKADMSDLVARMARMHGLACTEKGGYKIVDYHPKKIKYPFIIDTDDGRHLKMSPRQAAAKFGLVTRIGV